MEDINNCFECTYVIGNTLWFFARNYNGLYCFDIVTRELQSMGMVPWEKPDGKRLYNKMFLVGNNLILIPYYARYVAKYNLREKRFIKGSGLLDCAYHTYYKGTGFAILIPLYGCDALHYNFQNNKIRVIENLSNLLKSHTDGLGAINCCELNGTIYFILAHTNFLVAYNLESGDVTYKSIDVEHKLYTLDKVENNIYAIALNAPYAMKIDGDAKVLKQIKFYSKEDVDWENNWFETASIGNKLFISYLNTPLTIEISDGDCEIANQINFSGNAEGGYIMNANGDLWLLPQYDRMYISRKHNEIIKLPAINTYNVIGELNKIGETVKESVWFTLNDFLVEK